MVVTRRGRKVHTRKVSESINQAGKGSRFDSLTKDVEMETLAYENQSVDALFVVSTRPVSIMDTHEKGKVKYAKKADIHRVGHNRSKKDRVEILGKGMLLQINTLADSPHMSNPM